jgi:hypothetical protein
MATATAEAPPAEATAKDDKASAPKQPTLEQYRDELKKLDANAENERFKPHTNGQVLAVLEYQLATKGRKASDDLKPEHALLLRNAARAMPEQILEKRSLTAAEKRALVDFQPNELDDEQKARAAEKKGLTGKARFLWIVHGEGSREQQARGRAAAAPGDGDAPRATRPRKPKRWREGTAVNLTEDLTGSLAFLCMGDPLKGEPMTFLGQYGDDEFYDKVLAKLKRMKVDPDEANIVTLRGRNARIYSAENARKAAAAA